MASLAKLREELTGTRSPVEVVDVPISEEDVCTLLYKIDSSMSCGPDDLPGHLLKEGAPWEAKPLTKLYSMSLSQGILPRDWTSVNVSPVFKKSVISSMTSVYSN